MIETVLWSVAILAAAYLAIGTVFACAMEKPADDDGVAAFKVIWLWPFVPWFVVEGPEPIEIVDHVHLDRPAIEIGPPRLLETGVDITCYSASSAGPSCLNDLSEPPFTIIDHQFANQNEMERDIRMARYRQTLMPTGALILPSVTWWSRKVRRALRRNGFKIQRSPVNMLVAMKDGGGGEPL